MDYTIAQTKAFLGAVERAERARRFRMALDLRSAQADGPKWRSYIKAIEAKG